MSQVSCLRRYLLFIFSASLLLASFSHADDTPSGKRIAMVRDQIQARGIQNPSVLRAMRSVPRHDYVPNELRKLAYEDHPLPIANRQTISQPYIVALMTELIDPKKNDRVLEIGTGSGYQAAILAEIVGEVYTIEIIENLAKTAQTKLAQFGYSNIYVRHGDGYQGWPEKAPFDAIVVTAAPPKIPQPLIDQLAEGGKMIIPVADTYPQRLILIEKINGELIEKEIISVRFVPMTGEAQND